MEIQIRNEQRGRRIDAAAWRRRIRAMLFALGYPPDVRELEISVVFVADAAMQRLHLETFGKDSTTNVISFPLLDLGEGERPDAPLGDVVVNVREAEREAERTGQSVEARIAHLLIHGILHLLGHDHVSDRNAARRMRRRENRVLAAVADTL